MPTVSVSEFSRLLEFSQQRVSDMIAEGMPAGPPARGRGGRQVNLRAAVDWLIRKAVAKVQTPDDGETQVNAELRKARADADMAELRTAELSGRMVELEAVEATVERAMVLCAAQLDGLAGRVAARLAAESDTAVVRQVLFDETRRIRAAVAAELQSAAASVADGEGDSAAADEDAGSMGGSVPVPAARKRRAGAVAQ